MSHYLITATAAEIVMNKIDAPYMTGILRPQPNDRTVLVVQPLALLMPLRELQSFFPPHAGDLLVIDHPTFNTKQAGDLSITVSAILLG